MIIYYVIIITIAFLAIESENNKNKQSCLWAIIILMTLFQGLRWNTGADWAQYLWIFENLEWNKVFSFERGQYTRELEWGYAIINVVIRTIFRHYTFFLLITCGFINYTYYYIIRKYVNAHQGIALALAICYSSLFPVRQTLSAAVFFWGIPYILSKDWKKYIIFVFIAYSIHYSSLVLVLIYWLARKIDTKYLIVFYLSSSFLTAYIPNIYNFLISIPYLSDTSFFSLLDWYSNPIIGASESNEEMKQSLMSMALASFLILVFGWTRNNNLFRNRARLMNLLLNLYVVGAIGLSFGSIPGLSELSRLSYYSTLSVPIMMAYTLSSILLYYKGYYRGAKMIVICLYFYHFISSIDNVFLKWIVPYYSVFEDSVNRDTWY